MRLDKYTLQVPRNTCPFGAGGLRPIRYKIEIDNFKKILVGSRMIQISYGETFNLSFIQKFGNREMQFLLTLDASCWFGNRKEWMSKIQELKGNSEVNEREDCLLAYELTGLRYNNLIQVEKVDFFDDFLSITFQGENILSIAYYAESDYAWFLEEVSEKPEQERMMICCQGNELFQNNIPQI